MTETDPVREAARKYLDSIGYEARSSGAWWPKHGGGPSVDVVAVMADFARSQRQEAKREELDRWMFACAKAFKAFHLIGNDPERALVAYEKAARQEGMEEAAKIVDEWANEIRGDGPWATQEASAVYAAAMVIRKAKQAFIEAAKEPPLPNVGSSLRPSMKK